MRKRGRRKPRELINPLTFVFSGMKRVGGAPLTRALVSMHGAYEALRTGQATRAEFDALTEHLNMALALIHVAEHGVEYLPEILASHEAMRRIKERGIKATGPELTAVLRGVEIHDAQLQVSTVYEVEKAWAHVQSTVASQKARKV